MPRITLSTTSIDKIAEEFLDLKDLIEFNVSEAGLDIDLQTYGLPEDPADDEDMEEQAEEWRLLTQVLREIGR